MYSVVQLKLVHSNYSFLGVFKFLFYFFPVGHICQPDGQQKAKTTKATKDIQNESWYVQPKYRHSVSRWEGCDALVKMGDINI